MTSYRIVDDENHRVANVLREMERFQRVGQNMLHKSGIIRVIINRLQVLCNTAYANHYFYVVRIGLVNILFWPVTNSLGLLKKNRNYALVSDTEFAGRLCVHFGKSGTYFTDNKINERIIRILVRK